MEKISSKLQESVSFISRYLPLVNSHMVEFFSKNLWETHVPNDIKTEFMLNYHNKGNIVDIFFENKTSNCSELGKFLQSCSAHSLDENELIVKSDVFLDNSTTKKSLDIDCAKMDRFMSEKKLHEVKLMSELTACLFSITNATHIIDVGDGKGYLSSYLSLKYKIEVLGLDSSTIKTEGAAKRAHKLEKQWKSACNKYNNDDTVSPSTDKIQYKNSASDNCYKQVTELISSETDLRSILMENFPDNNVYNFGLVGLHTCGNLSPICLRQFLNNTDYTPFLINIGCCYHLLEEVGDSHTSTFPLSDCLKKVNFKLGRNARMLSLQAPTRIFASKKIPQSLLFRAVFEAFIEYRFGKCKGREREVGRIGSKCSSFVEYSRKGLKKLGFDIEVTDDEMCKFFERYSSSEELVEFYFMLRVALAPVIESIILLDRLLYLQENGIERSYLVKLFDSFISPRCYGIVAIR